MHFLEYHANKGTGYLHPGSKKFTKELLAQVQLKPGDVMLEIGCGTGATIVNIAKQFDVTLSAVDISAIMIKTAKRRAYFNKCSQKINFINIDADGKLPFPDSTFDYVYAESVLAIVSENSFQMLLSEILRVLKKNGKFVSNDAIWKNETSKDDIDRINRNCMNDFGICQSSSYPAYLYQWIDVFNETGFTVDKILSKKNIFDNKIILVSDFFTLYKKAIACVNPLIIMKSIKYKIALLKRHQSDGIFLENYMFVLGKNEGDVILSEVKRQ